MSALRKYTLIRFANLEKLLREYAMEPDLQKLHGIRVEVKKIKVILGLINTSVKGFHGHRHFIPLREIFRKAGQIRQPQVFYELLMRYEVQGVTDAQIPGSARQSVLSRKFKREVPEYLLVVRRRKKKLEKFLGRIKDKEVRKYVKERRGILRQMLQGHLSGSALHKARKVMKEIIYLDNAVHKGATTNKKLRQLEERIGQWHDQQLLLEVLTKTKAPELVRLRRDMDAAKRAIKKAVSDFTTRK